MYLHFFWFFLKVLELFEYRQDDSYMNGNRNFVRFAQSKLLKLKQYYYTMSVVADIGTDIQNIDINMATNIQNIYSKLLQNMVA